MPRLASAYPQECRSMCACTLSPAKRGTVAAILASVLRKAASVTGAPLSLVKMYRPWLAFWRRLRPRSSRSLSGCTDGTPFFNRSILTVPGVEIDVRGPAQRDELADPEPVTEAHPDHQRIAVAIT